LSDEFLGWRGKQVAAVSACARKIKDGAGHAEQRSAR
jgi:hypothetical protein